MGKAKPGEYVLSSNAYISVFILNVIARFSTVCMSMP